VDRHPPPEATLRRHEFAAEQHVELSEAPLLDLDLGAESRLQLHGQLAGTQFVAARTAVKNLESKRRIGGLRHGHGERLATRGAI